MITAEIALVSYTLLILFRNTSRACARFPQRSREAARGMGMSARQMLLRVELPLALPAIVAGLRIATVTVIALATIAYVISDQGLGGADPQRDRGGAVQDRADRRRRPRDRAGAPADALLVGVQRLLTPWTRASHLEDPLNVFVEAFEFSAATAGSPASPSCRRSCT